MYFYDLEQNLKKRGGFKCTSKNLNIATLKMPMILTWYDAYMMSLTLWCHCSTGHNKSAYLYSVAHYRQDLWSKGKCYHCEWVSEWMYQCGMSEQVRIILSTIWLVCSQIIRQMGDIKGQMLPLYQCGMSEQEELFCQQID